MDEDCRGAGVGVFVSEGGGADGDEARVDPRSRETWGAAELDAGDQIIHQDTFTVAHGTPFDEIVRIGETDHEPQCLVEGLRRVIDREVELHFHRVVSRGARTKR